MRQAEMEADHFRLQLFDDRAHRLIERRAVGGADRRGGIDPQFLVVSAKPGLPAGRARGIGIDRRVAEEVQVDGRGDALADDVDLLARLLRRDHRAWQRAQRPALRRRDHEVSVHDAGHRRQHDRKFGLEEVDDPAVWPHGSARLNELKKREDQAAKELRRPFNICSASVTILPTISAAGGISWISPTASPAMTAAISKLPAALAAAYSAATALTFCMSSTSRPIQRRACSLIRQRPVNGAGQTLLRDRSKMMPRTLLPLDAAQMRR